MIVTSSTFLKEQARSLIEKVIKQSQAEGVFVSIGAGEETLSRFSENQITQNVSSNRFNLSITSYFGKKSATASTTDLDPDAVTTTIRNSEELAQIAPEDPEWVPLLEPQVYEQRTPAFDEATATLSPLKRGEIIQQVCAASTKAGAAGSGTLSTHSYLRAIGNSTGLSACNQVTEADFSFTAKIDHGSSWSHRTASAFNQLPIEELTEKVISQAFASRQPREVSPGTYPVVFAGAAFVELLRWVIWNLDARAADEGRSFMSCSDGNRLGEAMFSPLVQVQRYPGHPLLQLGTFSGEGLSCDRTSLIVDGVPKTLSYSRYWANKQGKQPTGMLSPIVMDGSDRSLSDLIAKTERGIFVSRAWYVRYVNPKTLMVTGMTRDGTFWIENGQIAYPIKNLRFNQSLPEMLRDVDALSSVERYGSTVAPGARVRAFNFSSVTDSV